MGAYHLSLATIVSINVILALSLNLITGFCGQISLGHAAFFGVGAYAAALGAKAGWPLIATLPLGIVAAGAVGYVVGFCSLRVRDDFLAIATMGVGFLFLGVVRTHEALGGEVGLSGIPDHGLGPWGFLVLVALCAAAVALLCLHVKRSWLGFGFDAVAADQDAAQTIGIHASSYKLVAFALGTALAGLAGALYTYYLRSIAPDAFGFTVSITILSFVVIGGMGSVAGGVVAAILLTLMPEFFRFINEYKLLLYGGLLFLVMRFAPGGLAGAATATLTRRRA
jgi:branched-chain amino acid transport system permease protein